MTVKPVFTAETPEELFGELVGCASATRFWSKQDGRYPSDEGIFLDDNARALVDAAVERFREISTG